MSLTAVAMVFALGSCADESPWGNSSNEKGSISITLDTDSDITTAKPVFRSDDDDTRATSGMLADYITVPNSDDFSIRLEKADGTYAKTWATLADFKTDAANGFSTGTYTLTAFYGEKGVQDFESPYFEASSTFTVLSDQTSTVELTAELKNSMVKVNYTDNFKAYMQDYHSSLRTEGRSDEIVFSAAQTKPAFIEPKNAALTVHFTTKDKGFTSSIVVGQFAPQAKTLHNMTLDIGENQNGDASLSVTFDDTLEDENFTIDLTEELLTTPIPVITCDGFTDGQTVDMLEGSASETRLKMNIFAEAGIKSALMTVESTVAYKPAWGYEIDLCSANEVQQAQLRTAGIQATGLFHNPEQMAFLDLTEYGKSLKDGVYTISLIVTDKNDAVSKTTKVILNSLPITIELIGDPTIVYNSDQAVLTFDYNGLNPMQELTFTAEDDFGNDQDCQILSCEETNTRAFETKRYIFSIKLPISTKSKIKITAYHNHNKINTYEVPVIVPQYKISAVDAFSRYAYLKVSTPGSTDPNVLAAVTNNIRLRSSGQLPEIAKRDAANGILTITGLTPGSTNAVESTITGGDAWQNESSIITENELAIPNGDFSQQKSNKLESGTLNVGGPFRVTILATHYIKSSFSYYIPTDWANVNDLTAWNGAQTRNTWFVEPSSWLENGMGVMRSVGYNHNGTEPEITGSAASSTYYCTNSVGYSDINRAAGELFVGSYTFDGNVHRTDGIDFASRPGSISFDYIYTIKENMADQGYAYVEVFDADGNSIGKGEKNLSAKSELTNESINLTYQPFGGKASKLILGFKSSNEKDNTKIPIYIPTGTELDEGLGYAVDGNYTKPVNSYHTYAIGSELRIDNVTVNYGDGTTGASVPKRKTTSKKRK